MYANYGKEVRTMEISPAPDRNITSDPIMNDYRNETAPVPSNRYQDPEDFRKKKRMNENESVFNSKNEHLDPSDARLTAHSK
jgi:hypothetical protein